jgi:AcrR family transcriptional regulator
MEKRRPYRMQERALASEATGHRILAAAQQLFGELLYDQVSLHAVAVRAEVTVQTVLRRFTSKEELFAAVTQGMAQQIRHELEQAPVGEVTGAVRTKIEIYERWGDEVVHRLTQEQRTPAIRAVTEGGRRAHYAWVERVFGPLLADRPTDARRQQLAQLIAVTDLYVWKVLRRDLGLSREETERAIRDLVQRLTDPG